jgi:hypothetical protein
VSEHDSYDPDDLNEQDNERAESEVREPSISPVAEGKRQPAGDSSELGLAPEQDDDNDAASPSLSDGYGSSVEFNDDEETAGPFDQSEELDAVVGPRVVVGSLMVALTSLCDGGDNDRLRLLFHAYAANPRANAAASSGQTTMSQEDMTRLVASLLASPAHNKFPGLKAIANNAAGSSRIALSSSRIALQAFGSSSTATTAARKASESEIQARELAAHVSDAAFRRQASGWSYPAKPENTADTADDGEFGSGEGAVAAGEVDEHDGDSTTGSGDDEDDDDDDDNNGSSRDKPDAYAAAVQYVDRMSAFQHGRRGKGLTRASWSSCVLGDPLLYACLASSISPGGVTASINMGGAQQPRHQPACGYLWKRGSLSRIWKRRWVVLEVGKYSVPLLAAFRSHYTHQMTSDMLSRLPLYENGLRVELVGAAAAEAACAGIESTTLSKDGGTNDNGGLANGTTRAPAGSFSFSNSGGVLTAIAASKAAGAGGDSSSVAGVGGAAGSTEGGQTTKADEEDVSLRHTVTPSSSNTFATTGAQGSSSAQRTMYEFHVKVTIPQEEQQAVASPTQPQSQPQLQQASSEEYQLQQSQQAQEHSQGEERANEKADAQPSVRSRASSIVSSPPPSTLVWECRAHSIQELEHWLHAIDPRYSCRFKHTVQHLGL